MAAIKKPIKKAQAGKTVIDKTSVVVSKRKPDTVATKPNYTYIQSSKKDQAPTSQDSTNYKRGFNKGKEDKQSLFMSSDMNSYMGSVEGARNTAKSKKLKAGGKITKAKDGGKWMQKVSKSIEKRGTKGVCTGAKFGGPTCKPGTKRYALAKTFKSIAKKKK